MLRWLRQRSEFRLIGRELYERIVAQARSEAFYRDLSVADTMEGRFEMIALHLHLARERLRSEGAAGQRLGQIVLEHLIADMDDALRQMGYDMGVPRRVKKAAAAFGDRSRDYAEGLRLAGVDALKSRRDRLESTLMTHVFAATEPSAIAEHMRHVERLADYVCRVADDLSRLDSAELLAGRLRFPPIAAGSDK